MRGVQGGEDCVVACNIENDVPQGRRLQLEHGAYVRLRNQDGIVSNRVRVHVTERIRPECVHLVHGFGSESKAWKSAYLKGASTAVLSTRLHIDPLMDRVS